MPSASTAALRKIRAEKVNAGLDHLLRTREPGQRFSCAEIAAACGISKQAIHLAEKTAIWKLARAVAKKGMTAQDFYA